MGFLILLFSFMSRNALANKPDSAGNALEGFLANYRRHGVSGLGGRKNIDAENGVGSGGIRPH